MKTKTFGICMSALTIGGSILNAMQDEIGFVLWIIANIGWICYNAKTDTYEQIPIWVALTITSIMGLIIW